MLYNLTLQKSSLLLLRLICRLDVAIDEYQKIFLVTVIDSNTD